MSGQFPIEVTEKRIVKRITLKQSLSDFLDAFNVERGLVYTIKLLFSKPGLLIRHYLTDGRYRIVNAFRLLIITTAVSLLLLNITESFQVLSQLQEDDQEADQMTQLIKTLYTDWYNLVLWLSIPCYALFSYFTFKKYASYNYAEHLVIQSFMISASNLLVIICIPFGYLLGFPLALIISFMLSSVYYFFLFLNLYEVKGMGFFFRAFSSFVLGNLLYGFLFGVGLSVYTIIAYSNV